MEQMNNDQTIYNAALAEYTKEQNQLTTRLSCIDVELNKQNDYETDVEKLKEVLDEYLTMEHLTETIVNQLIERIEIGHPVKVDGVRQQEITIVYRFIGRVEEVD